MYKTVVVIFLVPFRPFLWVSLLLPSLPYFLPPSLPPSLTLIPSHLTTQFFISLHYHSQDSSPHSSNPLVERPEINTILQLRKQDSEFAALEGSVFSSVSDTFTALSESLQERLVRHVVAAFKTGCKRYRKESWHLVEKDAHSLWQEVSPSLSSVLPPLHQQLSFLREHVAVLLFPAIFNKIANHIDHILLSEVKYMLHCMYVHIVF